MGNKNKLSEREQIAERLREARTQAGLSQEQAAKLLQLQRPAISEIESGRRKVSAEEIIQFASLYKVNTSWLLLKDNELSNENDEMKMAAREWSKMKEKDRKKLIEILKILPNK